MRGQGIRLKPLVAALVLLSTLVAGCTAPETAPTLDLPVLPRLADHLGCFAHYPDGTPVSCTPDHPHVVPGDGIPTGWVCVADDPVEGWSLHWDPTTATHGVRVYMPAELEQPAGPVPGAFRWTTDGHTHLVTWDATDPDVFLTLPTPLGQEVTFVGKFYNMSDSFAANGADAATVTPVWSLYARQFWVTHVVQIGSETHTFLAMEQRNTTVRDADGVEERRTFVEPRSTILVGDDFTFGVLYEAYHFSRSLVPYATEAVDRDCMIDQLREA